MGLEGGGKVKYQVTKNTAEQRVCLVWRNKVVRGTYH